MRTAKIIDIIVVLILLSGVGFVYLAPESALRLVVGTMRACAGLERKEIRLPNGLYYGYLEGGKGTPLMLVHGFGANKDNFTPIAGLLTNRYRVIIPNLIGFGESSHPMDADYSPTAQAERLRDFSHALGITELHLGGNSMGGQIALTYAALHPTEVKSLWLLDPAGVWSGPNSMVHTTYKTTGQNPLIIRTEDDYAALMDWVMFKPPFIPRPLLDVLARERTSNQALEERILRDITTESVEQRVAGLTVPALIVWGSEDKIIHPETAKILNRLMPNSKVIIMPETGHLPMIEHPRQAARDYLAFRASLEPL